jgi:hypothetical protein
MTPQDLLPQATHIYTNVTQEEIDAVTVERYTSTYKDALILGTKMPVEELAAKLVQETGGMVFG